MGDAPGRVRVLHVEDDPDFAELAAELLERVDDDLAVELETDAEAGLERLLADGFDCVVSDYDLPGMDGLAFLEAVREEAPDLPFILFTGEGSEELASEAISAGVTDYLQKGSGTSQYELLANRVRNAVARHRARQAAAETEERLRTIADHADDILWMYTADWDELLFINAAYEEIWGRPVEELSEFPPSFQRGVHPDDRPITRGAMDRLSAGEPIDIEFRVNAEEDFGRWVWVKGSPVFDASGEVTRVTGFARDITDRRERERELELMDQLVREMNDGAVVARDGVVEYANPPAIELFGGDESAVVGESILEFVAPGDRQTVAERHRARLDGEADDAPEVYDITLENADGEHVPVGLSVSRIDYRGEPATLTLVRDVSDRRAREAELRRLKEEYETVFETAQDGIFLVDVERSGDDLDFRFRRLNPAHEASSGLSSAAIRGETPADFLGEADAAEVRANYRRCVEAAEPVAYDEVLEMPAGDIHWRTKLGPVVRDGEVTQIVGVARDVTHRRERERELERQNERLEQFTSVVSHDLRNPLTVAQGRLELARETGEDEHHDAVATAHDRMDALIDRLLTLASEGREVGELEPAALAELSEGCWATVETGGASLVARSERAVLADPTRLRQLLENLFRNAVEYGGDGVTVVVEDLANGFAVADDGPGLPDADGDRLYEPGFSTSTDGFGFGLSIVRDVAEAHGWDVSAAESEAGGARFEFTGVERP